jgi:hypothetical protein
MFPGPTRNPGNVRGTDRNRRASDYLQEDQRDRQTSSASFTLESITGFLLYILVKEWISQVVTTGLTVLLFL